LNFLLVEKQYVVGVTVGNTQSKHQTDDRPSIDMNLSCRGSVDGSVDIDQQPVDYVWCGHTFRPASNDRTLETCVAEKGSDLVLADGFRNVGLKLFRPHVLTV
jgi:hypothetical protein